MFEDDTALFNRTVAIADNVFKNSKNHHGFVSSQPHIFESSNLQNHQKLKGERERMVKNDVPSLFGSGTSDGGSKIVDFLMFGFLMVMV